MLDVKIAFSCIGVILGLILLFSGVILAFLQNNTKFYIMVGVGFLFLFNIIHLVSSLKKYYSAEETYKRLTHIIDSTEKELQKFYIDHPEFKENK